MQRQHNYRLINITLVILISLMLGVSCNKKNNTPPTDTATPTSPTLPGKDNAEPLVAEVVFPIADYVTNRTLKVFGQYVSDRFTGYHDAEDVEITDRRAQHEVRAFADGTIVYKKSTSGYGGLVIIRHPLSTGTVQGIYGHLSLSSVKKNIGDTVGKNEVIGYLGADKSTDTDGERQHLHFGLYKENDVNVSGYVSRPEQLSNWLNPTDFFQSFGLISQAVGQLEYNPGQVAGADDFNLSFKYPAGWRIEYVPQINALNLFTLAGAGAARERSQIFLRWFDANDFLTLSTVDILDQQEGETAGRRSITYTIKKRASEADFVDQPAWRNGEHRVTDIKSGSGFTRFYVVAQNPQLSNEEFQQFLNSIQFSDR